MGFSPSTVGLGNYPINSDFGSDRNGCPHSGIDIATGGIPTPFTAGIFGVVAGVGGQCSSVTVQPFHDQNHFVQYLHCSSIQVSKGDYVAPWTTLGTTGEVGCGATGVHLHLHVVKKSAQPSNPCWSRQYVDPKSWTTGESSVAGRYVGNRHNDGKFEYYTVLSVSGVSIGSSVDWHLYAMGWVGRCFYEKHSWYNGVVTSQYENRLWTQHSAGRCSVVVEGGSGAERCPDGRCKPSAGFKSSFVWESANSIRTPRGGLFQRMGPSHATGRQNGDGQPDAAIETGAERYLEFLDVGDGHQLVNTDQVPEIVGLDERLHQLLHADDPDAY